MAKILHVMPRNLKTEHISLELSTEKKKLAQGKILKQSFTCAGCRIELLIHWEVKVLQSIIWQQQRY